MPTMSHWDCCFGLNKPDLYVEVTVGGQTYRTRDVTGDPGGDHLVPLDLVAEKDLMTLVAIEVLDSDPGEDDSAGTCSYEITPAPGTVEIVCPRNEALGRAGWGVVFAFEPA